MQKTRTMAAALLALGLGAAAPASAIDNLTGVYEGKMSCGGVGADGTVVKKGKFPITFHIDDDGMFVMVDMIQSASSIAGPLFMQRIEIAGKEDRAKLIGATCLDDVMMAEIDVVLKPGATKGTLKGSMISQAGGAGICTFSLKRTATTDPEIGFCPAPPEEA